MLISHEYTLEIKLLVEHLADGMSSWMLSPLQLDLTLCNSMDCSPPGSSVHGIFQARILSGLPCPPPGDLPNPEIEPKSLTSPALAGRFLTTSASYFYLI